MTARIGATLAVALLATGWTAAALRARAQGAAAQHPAASRAPSGPAAGAGLLARARDWIARAGREGYQSRR